MQALSEWVRQLVVLVFVVSAAGLLLPTDTMRPYVRFVLGLVILSALMTSVFDLASFELNWDEILNAGNLSQSGSAPAEHGQRLAAAALRRLNADDEQRTRRRMAEIAETVLGTSVAEVMWTTDAGGAVRSVTVVPGASSDIDAGRAARIIGDLLGLEADTVTIASAEGGSEGNR